MCKSPLHPFLTALPKCEQHLHLEGTLEPSLLFKLSQRNNIPLPSNDAAFASPDALLERYSKFTSLDDFLQYYYIGMSVLRGTADYEELAWEYFVHAKRDGVVHAEVFFDPQAHTSRGVAYEVVVAGFVRACKRAEKELGISTLLIMCFLRHLPVEHAFRTLEQARPFLLDGTLAGVGMDSSEVGFQPELFKEVFASSKATGTRLTAHAGEEGGPEYVSGALEHLKLERIDHGLSITNDAALMKLVAERGLLVTTCPVSNLKLKCIKSIKDAPVRKFLDAGVKFSINSDDPSYFGAYIQDCYCAVQDAFNLSTKEWELIVRNSINGSWCNDRRMSELNQNLDDFMAMAKPLWFDVPNVPDKG
jgi:adenosine deaminase